MAPRTAIKALEEQQQMITRLTEAHRKTAAAQDSDLTNLLKVAERQQDQINRLTRGLQHLSRIAGLEGHVASAMGLKFVQADVENPAEPVPEPPAVPAVDGTVQTKTPEAFGDVTAPGLVPGSTNDVAADVTTTNYTPGQDVPAPAFRNLQDVTAPVDGTQTQRPLSETRTEHDVRVGDPMNPQTAFPLQGGFANAQRTASRKTAQQLAEEASNRTMASLRLARLRISAGLHDVEPGTEGADLELATRIEKDAALSTDRIEQEIVTLDAVRKRAQASVQRNPSLVPKSAARREAPPMSGGSRSTHSTLDDATDLFLS